ncbi:MAG TPA: DUF72 domain-containing protein [Mucilaginibacter sp.]
MWQGITHEKKLLFNPADVTKFLEVIDDAGDKSGCLLVQLSPRTTVAAFGQFTNLLAVIAENNKRWKVAVEFRHPSWYADEVYELLTANNAAMVLHDMPAAIPPMIETADFMYLRFHGPGGRYSGSYDDGYLYEYSIYMTEWLGSGKAVYAYFNNTRGEALNNLQTLQKYL